MTDCIAQLSFSFHKKRQVVADFSGGHLTCDAGLLPLRELDHRLGWTAAAAGLLTDSRDPSKVTHETTVLLRQRDNVGFLSHFCGEGSPRPACREDRPHRSECRSHPLVPGRVVRRGGAGRG